MNWNIEANDTRRQKKIITAKSGRFVNIVLARSFVVDIDTFALTIIVDIYYRQDKGGAILALFCS